MFKFTKQQKKEKKEEKKVSEQPQAIHKRIEETPHQDHQRQKTKKTEFKRGKKRNQPKQNKTQERIVNLPRDQEITQDNIIEYPAAMLPAVTQIGTNNDDNFSHLGSFNPKVIIKEEEIYTKPEKEETKKSNLKKNKETI